MLFNSIYINTPQPKQSRSQESEKGKFYAAKLIENGELVHKMDFRTVALVQGNVHKSVTI